MSGPLIQARDWPALALLVLSGMAFAGNGPAYPIKPVRFIVIKASGVKMD